MTRLRAQRSGAQGSSGKRWAKKRVIAAWHGPLTRPQVVARSGWGHDSVARFWREAQTAGVLPQGDRPHFPQRAAAIGKVPPAFARDVLDLRSVKSAAGWPLALAELAQLLAQQPEDSQLDLAKALLALRIVSDPNDDHLRITRADIVALEVKAIVMRHCSGEKPLPLIALFGDGAKGDARSLGSFADTCPVHTPNGPARLSP